MTTKTNEIYAQITPYYKYSIEVQGITFPDCILVDTWEGLAKFKTLDGDILMLDWGENIIGRLFLPPPKRCLIIKASPSILSEIMENQE